MEVTTYEGVTQLRLSREMDGRPLYWTAVYLVDGLLIDTGPAYTGEELVAYLAEQPPQLVVNTHYHEDHVGANRLIQETFGCTIYAPEASRALIGEHLPLYPYQELVWGYPEPSLTLPLPPIITTERHTFHVLSTPGHSYDHICLLEPEEGWCFTGDLFVGERVKTLRPEEDIGQTIASLRELASWPAKRLTLFSGTGRIFPEGHRSIQSFLQYITELAAKVMAYHQAGQSPGEIVLALFGREDPMAAMTNGQFTVENLVRSLIASEERRADPLKNA